MTKHGEWLSDVRSLYVFDELSPLSRHHALRQISSVLGCSFPSALAGLGLVSRALAPTLHFLSQFFLGLDFNKMLGYHRETALQGAL